MTKTLKTPIQWFPAGGLMALCDSEYLRVFAEAPWDEYLLRQSHIEYLKLLKSSYSEHIQEMALIKPTRKRFISEFEINIENIQPRIVRAITKPFGQSLAEIENNAGFDFRKLSRIFRELPEKYLTEPLYSLIRHVTKKILSEIEMESL